MNNTLQASPLENFCHRLTSQDNLSLFANYQLIPQLLCEGMIDRAIYSIECIPKKIEAAYQQFYQQWNLGIEEQQQLWQLNCGLSPVQFEAWCMIVRLEKLIPAQIDEQMRDRLFQEMFDTWLQEQVQQLGDRDKAWFGIIQEQLTNTVAA